VCVCVCVCVCVPRGIKLVSAGKGHPLCAYSTGVYQTMRRPCCLQKRRQHTGTRQPGDICLPIGMPDAQGWLLAPFLQCMSLPYKLASAFPRKSSSFHNLPHAWAAPCANALCPVCLHPLTDTASSACTHKHAITCAACTHSYMRPCANRLADLTPFQLTAYTHRHTDTLGHT